MANNKKNEYISLEEYRRKQQEERARIIDTDGKHLKKEVYEEILKILEFRYIKSLVFFAAILRYGKEEADKWRHIPMEIPIKIIFNDERTYAEVDEIAKNEILQIAGDIEANRPIDLSFVASPHYAEAKEFILKCKKEIEEEREREMENIPTARQLTVEIPKLILQPLDSASFFLFHHGDDITADEKVFPLKAEPDGEEQVTIFLTESLSELAEADAEAIKRLTAYDWRVYTAIGNLYRQGNDTFSFADLHHTMGHTGNPAKKQLKRMLQSIETLSKISVTINTDEEEAAGYNYPNLHIEREDLLYRKLKSVIKRGKETNAILILDEPVLFRYAISRRQYATLPSEVYAAPVNDTDQNLMIEDYLLKRITAKPKKGREETAKKILLETVCEKARITISRKRDKDRLKEVIAKLMNHYKEIGILTAWKFTETATGKDRIEFEKKEKEQSESEK